MNLKEICKEREREERGVLVSFFGFFNFVSVNLHQVQLCLFTVKNISKYYKQVVVYISSLNKMCIFPVFI